MRLPKFLKRIGFFQVIRYNFICERVRKQLPKYRKSDGTAYYWNIKIAFLHEKFDEKTGKRIEGYPVLRIYTDSYSRNLWNRKKGKTFKEIEHDKIIQSLHDEKDEKMENSKISKSSKMRFINS